MAVDYKRYRRYYTNLGPVMKSPVVRAYFAIILSVLTVAVFAAFAIRPTITTITTLAKKIEDYKEVSRKLDEKINAITRLQSDYQRIEQDLPKISLAMPDSPQEADAVIWLEKMATVAGVTIQGINVSKTEHLDKEKPATTSGAIAIPISISGTGSYESILSYLKYTGNLPRVYSTRGVQTAAGSGTDGKSAKTGVLMPFRIEVNAYYLP